MGEIKGSVTFFMVKRDWTEGISVLTFLQLFGIEKLLI